MKFSTTTILLSGLAAQQVSATWNRGARHFNTPKYNNNECSDKQKGGFNWGDLPEGDFNNYGDFDFKGGWKCSNSFGKRDALTKRSFGSKCIKNKVKRDTPATFNCDKRKDGFSVREIEVSVEYDTDLEFHYKMPDNSVCKQIKSCSKDGTVVENTQCGGARSVEVYLGRHNQQGREDCEIGFHHIDFDCDPGYTPNPPSPPELPSSPPEEPPVETPIIETPPVETPPVETAPPAEPPKYPTGGNNSVPDVPTYPATTIEIPQSSEVPEVPETPQSSEAPEYPETPVITEVPEASTKYPEVPETPISTEVPEVPEYPVSSGVPEVPETPVSSGVPEVPEYPVSSKVEEQPSVPVTTDVPQPTQPSTDNSYSPPECLPKCMNTWLEISTECKDNTDSDCYCKNPDFTKSVIECVAAWATDDETQQALQYLIGICANHVPENPGLITDCPTNIPINPTGPTEQPPAGPSGNPPAPIPTSETPAVTTPAPICGGCAPPAGPVTTITYETTYTVPATEGKEEETKTISTTVTVPQVIFTTETPANPPAPGVTPTEQPVALVPGTPVPVTAVPTEVAPYPIPSGETKFGTVTIPVGTGTGVIPNPPAEFTGAASSVIVSYKSAMFGAALAFFAL